MRRIAALAIPSVALMVVAVGLAALETRRRPDWRMTLDEYIAHSASPSETVTVQSVAEAREPWNLRKGMWEAVPDDWTWTVDELPFPPLGVQCVLLERARRTDIGNEQGRLRQVVFVGYHTDGLYRVGWVVHSGPDGPLGQELQTRLAEIGCELDLE